jgi:hypothetical protein
MALEAKKFMDLALVIYDPGSQAKSCLGPKDAGDREPGG